MAKSKIFQTATNEYEQKGTLGGGGSGTVYLVSDPDGQPFTLKLLRESNTIKRKRFKNELSFCQETRHDNIVPVYDSGIDVSEKGSFPFYVMPRYADTLRGLIDKKLSPEQVLPLFDNILSGVEAAHLRGIFHRDLKPENILYDSKVNRLLVGDFGIAHFEEDDLLTAVETKNEERLANFTYAAPEQRGRDGRVNHLADIFALGLILNEMFTRAVPLGVGHPLISQTAPQFAYLDEVADRMIRHSPSERYLAIAKIKEDLIARGNAFVALQRLDRISKEVVSASVPDDPLGGVDVRVSNVDYEPGAFIGSRPSLTFTLQPLPPPRWQVILKELKGTRHIAGCPYPGAIEFLATGQPSIPISANSAKEFNQLFKEWVEMANKQYCQQLVQDAEKEDRLRREGLAKERARAEEKARVMKDLQGLV
jgi:serine/threonine protein kinase